MDTKERQPIRSSVSLLGKQLSRRDAIKAGGIAVLGLTFTKPVIETIYPKPAFAQMSPGPSNGGTKLRTFIPYLSTRCKYRQVSHGDLPGFEQPAYDDSAWASGDAAFGTASTCALNMVNVKTDWTPNTDMLLRKEFNLPAGATDVVVGVAIDNDVQVWFNGMDISGGMQVHETCAILDSFVFPVPNSYLIAGTNLVAIRGRDRGSDAYVDFEVRGVA
jgi:hypothetical protein